MFKDYIPFGSGLGSFGTAAAAKEYSPLYYKYQLDNVWGLNPENPMFLADAFYPTLAEFGVDKAEFDAIVETMAQQALASGSPNNNPRVPTIAEMVNLYQQLWT